MGRARVLYVTDRFDGPYRYRCQQACEQLREDGAVANVARVDDPRLLDRAARYGAIVLFRLPWSAHVEAVVDFARRRGIPLFFDIDDLTFDPSFGELMPFRARYSAAEWARAYGRDMAGLRRTFDAADFFIGSTDELALHARALGKEAFVHRNVVPESYLRNGRLSGTLRDSLRPRPTLGYFSGSDTHGEDFGLVAGALSRVLHAMRDARLLVVGYLDVSALDPALVHRVVRLPYMHWRDFPLAYVACHAVIAPLAVRNAFTHSKSALKFFEAGAFGTPAIATPVREMERAIADGETGFLADSEESWVRAMTLALDSDMSFRIGMAARGEVERSHSMASVRGALLSIFASRSVPTSGIAPRPTALDPPDETGRARAIGRLLRPGRRTRDLARIVRAARRAPGPAVDIARLERFLDALVDGNEQDERNETGSRADANGAIVLWHRGSAAGAHYEQVISEGEIPGEYRSTGSDPSITLGELSLEPRRYRYLLLRLRVRAETPSVRVQIYWKNGDAMPFSERRSVTRTLRADGVDRTFLVDLRDEETGAAFRDQPRVTHVRIDPTDRTGSFRVGMLALLGEEAIASSDPRAEQSSYEAPPARVGTPGEISAALLGLARGGSGSLRFTGAPAEVRALLGEQLSRHGLALETLRRDGSDLIARIGRREDETRRGVDVVVPIWNARALVVRCLESVKRHAPADARIVAIDDASSDPGMKSALAEVARGDARVILLQNATNLGFVGTANRGIVHAGDRDVLLLNSDTEVFEGFLEKLSEAAYSGPRVGMVSPLSNNATICSVPEFVRENPIPSGLTGDEMAALVDSASERRRPHLVTPHGFCLYLRRDCLSEIGLLDEERFGRGFGEENDLGERAKARGFEIRLADDVYVFHAGKASFSDEGRALERKNQTILEQRHPGYHAAVATFVRDNPLAPVHRDLARHLERRSDELMPAPLFVLHADPFAPDRGGVEYCVCDLVRGLELPRAVLVYPRGDCLEVAEVFRGDVERPMLYRHPIGYAPERFCHEHPEVIRALGEILDLHRIAWAHVHHLMFLPLSVGALLRARGIPYVVTVHDFYPACPSYNFVNLETIESCCPESCTDSARTEACQRALFRALCEPMPANPAAFVGEHRIRFRAILDGAVETLFPSPSTRRLTARVLPLENAKTSVVPHGVPNPDPIEPGASEGPLRVALVGQIAYPVKGSAAYLATMAACEGTAIEWHVFGRTDLFDFEDRLAALHADNRIVCHGAYRRDEIVERLRAARIDVGLLLPAWPETFSYTRSEIESAGVPIVARRIGALEDHLSEKGHAVLVEDAADAARALLRLAADRGAVAAMARAITRPSGDGDWIVRHRALYDDCAARSPVQGPEASPRSSYRRLNELAVLGAAAEPPATITRPRSRHVAAWWYPYAERAKPYVPESLRHVVRRRLAGDSATRVLEFRLPGKQAHIVRDLSLDRRYLGTTQLTAHGADAQLVIELEPLDPARVQLVHFNLWCSTDRPVHAQFYFRHEGAPTFDEAHSITVPLDGRAAAWQEYVIFLETNDRRAAWYEGGPIVALRFDPIDAPGPVGLGKLMLSALPRGSVNARK